MSEKCITNTMILTRNNSEVDNWHKRIRFGEAWYFSCNFMYMTRFWEMMMIMIDADD